MSPTQFTIFLWFNLLYHVSSDDLFQWMRCCSGRFHEMFWPTTYFTIPHFLSGALLEAALVFYTIPNDPLPIVSRRIRVSELAISNGTHQQSEINWPYRPIQPLDQPRANSNLLKSTSKSRAQEFYQNVDFFTQSTFWVYLNSQWLQKMPERKTWLVHPGLSIKSSLGNGNARFCLKNGIHRGAIITLHRLDASSYT